jgi:hypothetical protein
MIFGSSRNSGLQPETIRADCRYAVRSMHSQPHGKIKNENRRSDNYHNTYWQSNDRFPESRLAQRSWEINIPTRQVQLEPINMLIGRSIKQAHFGTIPFPARCIDMK